MRFGVVGTNFVSDAFMQGAELVNEVEVTAVCSGKRENAERFARKYGIANVYDDYLSMIDSGTIDAIYLAVPNNMHYQMAIECLKRHVPTFCEKPMGGNYRQVKQMIDTAVENNTYLHDGTVPLYSPNIEVAREYLKKLGRIRRAVFSFGKYSSRYDAYLRNENPTTFRKELYNGSLMDIGVYVVADAVALFGKPQEIFSSAVLLESGADCMGTMVFRYPDFECVLLHSKVTDTAIVTEIQGEQGNLYLPHPSLMDTVYYHPRKNVENLELDENGNIQVGVKCTQHFAQQLEDFVYNVKNHRMESALNPHQQILDLHEVLTECRKKAGIVFDCDGE